MTNSKLPDLPTEGGKDLVADVLKRVLRATSGIIPGLGPYLAEVIDYCYLLPIEKRRTEWFAELERAFRELTQKVKGLTPEVLAENAEFITILHRATDIALRTHQSEKRRLLGNAIVSAGSPTPPELDKQTFFLRLADELTINQVLVLLLYRNPLEWFRKRNRKPRDFYAAARIEVLSQAYPEIAKDPDFKEVVLAELERRGLLHGLSGMVSGDSVYNPMTSKLGREFLEYVRAQSVEESHQ